MKQSWINSLNLSFALLLADLFLYSYETDFMYGLLKKNEKKLARSFNFTFRYIENVLSLNLIHINGKCTMVIFKAYLLS
jgi:hypothetical protein